MKAGIHSENRIRSRNALIIFTREPVPGMTKTRLMPYYTPEQCAGLHECFLKDICREMKKADADILVSYTGGEPVKLRMIFGRRTGFFGQEGDGLGERMENAISHVLDLGYERAVLIGTDIPEIRAKTIDDALDKLDSSDIVIGPTADGGYYLIGMKRVVREAFDISTYGTGTVFDETVSSMKKAGLSVSVTDMYSDIDEPSDVAGLRHRIRRDGILRGSHTARFLRDSAKISVIVPVYNESKLAGRMAEQLRAYKNDAEIIFCDGGSTDDTLSVIGDEFTVLHCEKGRGKQLNKAAGSGSGDILFFLHCDSILPKNAMSQIRRVMGSKEWGCFGVKFPSRNFFMLTNRIISNHRALARRLPFGDQGIFIDREVFFDAGMFPDMPFMEDYQFAMNMKASGLRPGMTQKRISSSTRRYGKGTIGILRTEFLMWNLRRLYRKGVDIEKLAESYKDRR